MLQHDCGMRLRVELFVVFFRHSCIYIVLFLGQMVLSTFNISQFQATWTDFKSNSVICVAVSENRGQRPEMHLVRVKSGLAALAKDQAARRALDQDKDHAGFGDHGKT